MKPTLQPLLFAALAAAAAIAAGCGSSGSTNVTGPTAARCTPSISNSSPSFGAGGGNGTVTVSVPRECSWSASSAASWISITGNASGQGDGTIAYRVAENGEPTVRRGSITVGDQHADIGQEAGACEFSLSTPSTGLDAAGGRAVVDVRTQSACGWQARSDAAWATVQPLSGTGAGEVTVAVSPNDGAERTVTVTIAGLAVTLRQMSVATPSPIPTPLPNPSPSPAPSPTPTPTPAPIPPSPTPPPVTIDLSGKINNVSGACPDVQFSLKGYVVQTNSDTVYVKSACTDVKNGKDVTLTGIVVGTTTVTATVMQVKK